MAEKNRPDDAPVSPAAKKLAEELGIDINSINGSGNLGRVLVADVNNMRRYGTTVEGSGYRKKVSTECTYQTLKIRHLHARKMEDAWKTIPHSYVTVSVNMTDVVRIRHDYKVTVNDFVITAVARALVQHPWVNATWNGEQAVELPRVNIAMAVATDRGLYYPVLHDCSQMNLSQISRTARDLLAVAETGELSEAETADATFTISNMGMMGVESFAAIITPPQAAVLSVGSVNGEVIVDEQGEPAVALMMKMTLSSDHRVLDGADAADFLDTVRCYLEAPVMLAGEN